MISHATEEPAKVAALLNYMTQALRTTDYRGIFTYEYGGALQTLRLTHQVIDGEEHEHLEYLNGPARRVERMGNRLECLSPVEQILRSQLPDGENFLSLTRFYQFSIRGTERIAGRQATLLQVVPRDDHRFGYSISIDTLTGLPLGVITLNSNRKVLERLQFASLDVSADDSWVEVVDSSTQVKQVAWNACSDGGDTDSFPWQIGWIPEGFITTGVMTDPGVGDIIMYSDGLSSFSVFVRPMQPEVSAQGKAQRGATVAYMHQQMMGTTPHTITVVGEIPARTAQRIASSVRERAVVEVPVDEAAFRRFIRGRFFRLQCRGRKRRWKKAPWTECCRWHR